MFVGVITELDSTSEDNLTIASVNKIQVIVVAGHVLMDVNSETLCNQWIALLNNVRCNRLNHVHAYWALNFVVDFWFFLVCLNIV